MPMGWVAAGSAILGAVSASNQASAAKDAANTQAASAQAGIDEQQRQFDAIQKLLAPYVTAGNGALTAQQNLLGIGPGGAPAQQQAVNQIEQSPIYTSALAAGNRNILANASATGGLRGGNVQAALGQFAPQLLAQTIQQQYGNLAGMSTVGQNAAAGVGTAGLQTGNSIASLLGQQGAAQAGGILGQGVANTQYADAVANAIGAYGAMGGFKSTTQPYAGENVGGNGLTTMGGGGF